MLIIKASKETILTAKVNGEFKFYLAPVQIGGKSCLAVITAFFDDPDNPLTILSPLIVSERLPQDLERLPDAFNVCFFDEQNREVFACKADAELTDFRKALQACVKAARSEGSHLMECAERWFAQRTECDDLKAFTVKLNDILCPRELAHYNLREDDHRYLGSRGFSCTTLRRPEPGSQQELDIVMLLQRVYAPSRIVHSPTKVTDNEELVDIAVAGAHYTLLIQAKDSPNTDQTLRTSLARKQSKSVSQLKGGLSQLGGAVSCIRRTTSLELKLAEKDKLDIDLSARPLIGVVIVKELFPGKFDAYSDLAIKTMKKLRLPVVFFDYPEFERMTRHCTSEAELISAFDQILEVAIETGIYPRMSFETSQA
ncbi:hypothetical protein [Pseudomonas entomophila]|uniref:hypothetical protein n=1 Tax=Pseudomonas entomophila TaxID=312306 RepID=UPI002159A0C9|nr:hypothetical protein [Pseudomonas entomophila]